MIRKSKRLFKKSRIKNKRSKKKHTNRRIRPRKKIKTKRRRRKRRKLVRGGSSSSFAAYIDTNASPPIRTRKTRAIHKFFFPSISTRPIYKYATAIYKF